MATFLVRRLLHAVAVMVVAVTLGFALVHLAPGDALTGDVTQAGRSAEAQARLRARAGLDQPLPTQYRRFVGAALRGDLGHSLITDQPVVRILGGALRNSLTLAGCGLLAAVALGLVIGSAQGWRPRQRTFRLLGRALTALYAVPEFVLAISLIGLLAYGARWFPVGGMHDPVTHLVGTPAERLADALRHLVLPTLTLALGWGAAVARQQRVAVGECAGQDFIRTARAKGRSDVAVLTRHALPTTVAPFVTVIGLMLPAMVGGSVIVEVVFAWPGLGAEVVHAVAQRDAPVVSGAIVVISLLVAGSSLLIDFAVRLADPRQRTAGGSDA
ncbi:MAG: ABC transporter permease [Gemmatimonadaceae bacterium]|nr:ABC transporter permease [Gemmatimonadaceae bacterium]